MNDDIHWSLLAMSEPGSLIKDTLPLSMSFKIGSRYGLPSKFNYKTVNVHAQCSPQGITVHGK